MPSLMILLFWETLRQAVYGVDWILIHTGPNSQCE